MSKLSEKYIDEKADKILTDLKRIKRIDLNPKNFIKFIIRNFSPAISMEVIDKHAVCLRDYIWSEQHHAFADSDNDGKIIAVHILTMLKEAGIEVTDG